MPITSRSKTVDDKVIYGMRIDWEQVDRVIESIRDRLYEITLPTERAYIVAKYDLEEYVRKTEKRDSMASRLWD